MFTDVNDKLYQKITGSRHGYDVIEYYISYDKGSYNYWYSQTNTRGYYLHATPMKRCGVVNSYCLLGDESGGKMQIVEVETRRSKKLDQKAVEEANACLEQIGNIIAGKCGYTLGEFTK